MNRGSSAYHGNSAYNGYNNSSGPTGTSLNPCAADNLSGNPLRLVHWWDF